MSHLHLRIAREHDVHAAVLPQQGTGWAQLGAKLTRTPTQAARSCCVSLMAPGRPRVLTCAPRLAAACPGPPPA